MGLPSLRELLQLPGFSGVQLLSGQARLGTPVAWVHVAEVMDAWRFLSGGELLLSTGLELARANSESRAAYVRSLVQAGAVGLVLELVQGLREVPPEMLQTARLLEFPLLVFEHEVRFADLTRAAHQRILQPAPNPSHEPLLGALIKALYETGRANGFLQQQLGPLLQLPSRPRNTLLATLEALLASQFNIAETARKLGVRRQSIYYRLEQLQAMLGNLEQPERRLGLWVALELLKNREQA